MILKSLNISFYNEPLESAGKCIKLSPVMLIVGDDDGGSNEARLPVLKLLELRSPPSIWSIDWVPPPSVL